MTPAPFDFRQPPPGVHERRVADWLAAAARRAAGAWGRLLPFSADLVPGAVRQTPAAAALADLPDDAVGFSLTADPADGTAVLATPRPFLLVLLGGLLGDAPTDLPADREPSALERSLVEYAVRSLFLDPLEAAWPGDAPLHWTAGPPVAARSALRGGNAAVAADLTVRTAFGDHLVRLVVPRTGRWEGLADAAPLPPAVAPDPERIAALVREMPVELEVVLGTAELTMSEAAGLRAGDLLVLRRKVGEPLDAVVGGTRKFRVGPGAVGARAAVQILFPADA